VVVDGDDDVDVDVSFRTVKSDRAEPSFNEAYESDQAPRGVVAITKTI
jgi:hypothetical protein